MTSLDETQDNKNLGPNEETIHRSSDSERSTELVDGSSSKLCLLLRVKGNSDQPLPMNMDFERFIGEKLEEFMGIQPISVNRMNIFDTIVMLSDETTIFEVAQAMQKVQLCEGKPIRIHNLIGTHSYISEICKQHDIILGQQAVLQEKAKQFQRKLQERDHEIDQRRRWYEEELAKHDESRNGCLQRWKTSLAELTQQMGQQSTLRAQRQFEPQSPHSRIPETGSQVLAQSGVPSQGHFVNNAEANPVAGGEGPSIQKQLKRITTLLQKVGFRNKYKEQKYLKILKKDTCSSSRNPPPCHCCLRCGHPTKSCSYNESV